MGSSNGSFRSLKEECVWQHVFRTFEDADASFERLQWFNQERRIRRAVGARSNIGRNK